MMGWDQGKQNKPAEARGRGDLDLGAKRTNRICGAAGRVSGVTRPASARISAGRTEAGEGGRRRCFCGWRGEDPAEGERGEGGTKGVRERDDANARERSEAKKWGMGD